MHGRKSLVLFLALFIILAAQPAASQTANDFYASCVVCHTLPLDQAQGMMAPHGGWSPPPTGFIDDACSMSCHEWTPPEGHFGPPMNPFYWLGFLDPGSYPAGSSVTTQMCETCHDTTVPPLNAMHPNDQIPYLPSATTPPPSVLPLFEPNGLPNQDPFMGGMTCSTCHDPHAPGYFVPSINKPAFLRVGDPSGDTAPLCATCHTETGPQTLGHDIFIDSLTTSVTFRPPQFGYIDIEIIVQNRGTADYFGGNFDVLIDDGGGAPFWVGSGFIPYIPAGSSDIAFAPIPEMPIDSGYVFQFVLEPSEMNPFRYNTFARAISTPPAPEYLRVIGKSNNYVDLQWDPPIGFPSGTPITYDVYRNGIKVNTWPLQEWETYFSDYGLAPDTPHTYTVAAVSSEGFSSPMSNRVGALTDSGFQLLVPGDYPTIELALQAAGPDTTIIVAPGTYSEPFMVQGGGIAIKGQDANGCILDLSVLGEANIDGAGPNSISGFTVINGRIVTGDDDTVAEMIFKSSPSSSIEGGGFVTNSIFEELGAPSIVIPQGRKITVANSIFRTGWPLQSDYSEDHYLLNNSFPGWYDWQWLWPGEGNFTEEPYFVAPGPPERYFIQYGPGYDTGADVGLPFTDFARDVGVFEIGVVYTARPPTALSAQWVAPGFVDLTWQPSPDEDIYSVSYEVFRSDFPDFPAGDDIIPYATVPPGQYYYADSGTIPGLTHYYRVRAVTTVRSEPTNTVSIDGGGAVPVAADDTFFTDEDTPLYVPPMGVLDNDTDDDGDALTALLLSGPSSAQFFALRPDGSFDYDPTPEWSGTDSFTYFATDNINDSNTATVTIIVNPVNDPPIAVDNNYAMPTQWTSTGLLVLLNDSDPEGDPLTIDSVGTPDQGGTAVNLGNVIDYAPVPGFVGIESFTYTASDGNGGLSQAQITVNVINDPPTANDDSYTTGEDQPLSVPAPGVLGNDTDPYDDPLTALLETGPANGLLSLNPDGSFTYTPNGNFFGTDSFTYRALDPWIDSASATVSITVGAVNDAPLLVAIGPQNVAETGSLNIGLSATDLDAGDTLNFIALNLPSFCSLADNGNRTGSIDCNPGYDDAGSYDITVIVSDSGSPVLDDSEIFTLTVSNTNRAPLAADDSFAADEDVPLIVAAPGVLGNDFDPDGDSLEAVLVGGTANGLLVLNPDGSFTYTPDAEYSGIDTFSYFAGDGLDSSPAVFVTITVNAVNDPPVLAAIGAQGVAESGSTAIGLSATDIDPGDILSFSAPGLPVFCSLADYGNGAGSVDCSPGFNDAGSYDITVTASDNGTPVLSDNETFTLTVTGTNRAPQAFDDSFTTDEDTPLYAALPGVLGNDSDPDGDPLTAVLLSGVGNGVLSMEADGSFTYTPDVNFFGTDSFTYLADDGQTGSNTAVVTITVNSVNDPPVVINPGDQSDNEGAYVNLAITSSDPDGDPLTYSATGLPPDLAAQPHGSIGYSLTYESAGVHSVSYTVSDGLDETTVNFTWTVADMNRWPVAVDDAYVTDEDTLLSVTAPGILGNDSDPDGDSLTAVLVSGVSNGGLTLNSDGSFDYTPAADFNGTDSFTYCADDGPLCTYYTTTVTITVNAVNDPPLLGPIGPQAVAETAGINIGFAAGDVDTVDTLSFTSPDLPSFCFITDNGNRTGSVSCSPGYDDAGSYDITVTVNDNGTPALSDNETFTLTVTNVNRTPNITNPGPQTNSEGDSGISLQIVASDADLDTLSYSATGLPAGLSIDPASGLITGSLDYSTAGTYSVDVTVTDGQDPAAVNFSWTVGNTNRAPVVTNPGPQTNSEGDSDISLQIVASDADLDTLAYSATGLPAGLGIDPVSGIITGSLDYSTAGPYSVDVTVTDGQDPTAVNFSWNVTDVPIMHVESITTGFYVDKGKTYYTADVLVLDDGGAPVAGVDVTAHWTGSSADSAPATGSSDAGGVVTFTTNGIKKPSGVYVITITNVVKAGYTFDVAGSATSGQYPPPAQNPPAANDDTYVVAEGAALNIAAPGVLDNDTDIEGDPLTAVLAGGPSHGNLDLNADGSFTYSHDGSETTVDSFTYRANDGADDSNTATVTITVTAVNDAPAAANDSASTQLNTSVIVDVLSNDIDADGDTLTVSAATNGTNGSVVNNGSDVTYTPNPDYSGPDSFTYTATDGNGGFDTATVSVSVSAGNLPPTAFDDTAVTDANTAVTVDVLANDTDPDGDTLTVSAVTQGANGSVVNNGADVTYTPDPGYSGPDSFTYTASDGNGGFDTATVSVTVNAVGNLPPVADAGPDQSGARRQNLTFDGSGSYDPDGSIVSWSWDFGDGKSGSGEIVVHKFTKNGTFTVTLTVTDNNGAEAVDTAVVTIN